MTEARSRGLSSFMGGVLNVLHLAPHPDDEAIGAGATLLALRAAGHRVVNLAVTLGRPEQEARRRREVETACERAGFELLVHRPDRDLTATVATAIDELRIDLLVAPSPHDGHHEHERVGRAARDAVHARREATPPRLWLWGLWADLPWPTLYHGFDEPLMQRTIHVLEAHEGELERNDYRALVRARATANRVLGAERVFGWGAGARPQPYAELLTEVVLSGEQWLTRGARELDPNEPLREAPAEGASRAIPIAWWLNEPSFTDRTRGASP
jgi:LmbE family N-acetylglucosaminyl deacetylase